MEGHDPDYIGDNPAKYGRYVDNLYGILSAMNGGKGDPNAIAQLKSVANGFAAPGFRDFLSEKNLNGKEIEALRNLPGGYKGSFTPEAGDEFRDGMKMDHESMMNLINKIKNGSGTCCPE